MELREQFYTGLSTFYTKLCVAGNDSYAPSSLDYPHVSPSSARFESLLEGTWLEKGGELSWQRQK